MDPRNLVSEVLSIISILGGSVSNRSITIHYGYTTFITRLLLALTLFAAYLTIAFPSKMSCDGKGNIPSEQMTYKCKTTTIFFKFGENAAQYFYRGKSPQEISKVYVHEYLPYLILLLLGISFTLPRFLWKVSGGKHIATSLLRLKGKISLYSLKEKNLLVEELKKNLDILCQEKLYMLEYFVLQSLSVVILYLPTIAHILFYRDIDMSQVLREVMTQRYELRTDILQEYFPTLVGCVYFDFGPSGTTQIHNTLCTVNNHYTVQVLIVLIYFVSFPLAILTTIDLVYQLLYLLMQKGSDWNTTLRNFYNIFLYINYPHNINKELLFLNIRSNKIKVSQA